MTRVLPWTIQPGGPAGSPRRTRPGRGDNLTTTRLIPSSRSARPSHQDDPADNKDELIRSSDEDWRITESEFGTTAHAFAQDLHKREYDKLCQQQRREAERSATLHNLLDEPTQNEILPALPPRRHATSSRSSTDLPSATMTLMQRPFGGNEAQDQLQNDPSRKVQDVSLNTNAENQMVPHDRSTVLTTDNTRPPTLKREPSPIGFEARPPRKMTEAAAARRRKREEAQKAADVNAIPMF